MTCLVVAWPRFTTYLMLWSLGVLLFVMAIYLPNASGFWWLGAITIAFGIVLAWVRRD